MTMKIGPFSVGVRIERTDNTTRRMTNQVIERSFSVIISALYDNFKLGNLKEGEVLRVNYLRSILSGEIPLFRDGNMGNDKYRLLSIYLFYLQIIVNTLVSTCKLSQIDVVNFMTLRRDLRDLLDDLLLSPIADMCEKLLQIIDNTYNVTKQVNENVYYKIPKITQRSAENVRFTRGMKRGYTGMRLHPSMLLPATNNRYEGRLPSNQKLDYQEKHSFRTALTSEETEKEPLLSSFEIISIRDDNEGIKQRVIEIPSQHSASFDSLKLSEQEKKEQNQSSVVLIKQEENIPIPQKVDGSTPFSNECIELDLSNVKKGHKGEYIRCLIRSGTKNGQCCLVSKHLTVDDVNKIKVRFTRGDEFLEANTRVKVEKKDMN